MEDQPNQTYEEIGISYTIIETGYDERIIKRFNNNEFDIDEMKIVENFCLFVSSFDKIYTIHDHEDNLIENKKPNEIIKSIAKIVTGTYVVYKGKFITTPVEYCYHGGLITDISLYKIKDFNILHLDFDAESG